MDYTYDGTFDGLLSVVFERYKRKDLVGTIQREDSSKLLQGEYVSTDIERSARVYNKLEKLIKRRGVERLYIAHLSEECGVEDIIFTYIVDTIKGENKFDSIEAIDAKVARVAREAHRFKGFVRFRRLKDNGYYALIEPSYNILPLIGDHFKNRYSNQNFIICDTGRDLALVYKDSVGEIIRVSSIPSELREYKSSKTFHREEDKYIALWRVFFKSLEIKERKNLKCQQGHMPKKYWKNLIEIE